MGASRKSSKKSAPRDVAQDVTDLIMAQLDAGTVPWHQPWKSTGGALPRSMSTGRTYRGMNSILLGMYAMAEGYTSPWWGTYRQIGELGGQVKKGEKSSLVILYRTIEKDDVNANGEDVVKRIPLLRAFNVFNASQCVAATVPEDAEISDEDRERLNAKEAARWAKYTEAPPRTRTEHEAIDDAEAIVKDYFGGPAGPTLTHGGDQAFYSPALDGVAVPHVLDFKTPEGYYSTLFHEATHSTGHKSRLNREGIVEGHRFGDALYAAEELIAEMGAAMLCAIAGVDQTNTVPASAAYIENWLGALKGDKKLVLKAAAAAQRAANLIAPEPEDESDDEAS